MLINELIITIPLIFMVGLCWGSFLNVVAYRIVFDKPFFAPRSHCPNCNELIAWYHNIPVFSWFWLRGSCFTCNAPISPLYPCIEIATALAITGLCIVFMPDEMALFWIYGLLISALIVSTRTDLEAMVIPQLCTLWLIPIGMLSAWYELLPITLLESILGCVIGYGLLFMIAKVFTHITHKDGLGEGDWELLAMIGSFLGVHATLLALIIASTSATLIGGLYIVYTGQTRTTKIPFGPFLAVGTYLVLILHNHREFILSLMS